jgi:hypothetical protein
MLSLNVCQLLLLATKKLIQSHKLFIVESKPVGFPVIVASFDVSKIVIASPVMLYFNVNLY